MLIANRLKVDNKLPKEYTESQVERIVLLSAIELYRLDPYFNIDKHKAIVYSSKKNGEIYVNFVPVV
jgi:hypothetical protein